MLKNINKLLTGNILKILCDMGHGDELVTAKANFPAVALAIRLIRLLGIDGVKAAEAILSVFPLDTYTDPVYLMDLTEDNKKRMSKLEILTKYHDLTVVEPKKLKRYEFYERANKAYAIIQTGEKRQYGNLILVKGVVI